MNNDALTQRLAVCSWSLQPETPQDLIDKLQAAGIRRVQLALDPLRETPDVWRYTQELLRQNQITVVSGMFGCVGEDYSTLETIRLTGGLAPEAMWEQNWKQIQVSAAQAQKFNLKLVTFHAGFLPHDENDPSFARLKRRLHQVAEAFQSRGIALGLETGQETAEELLAFLKKLDRPNLGVNFDPANMILYDKGNPIEALHTLGPWIRQVHLKDAVRTTTPGTWGDEVVAGTGEVDWPAFFAALRDIGFAGDLCIEREAGMNRVEDIRTARELVEKISR